MEIERVDATLVEAERRIASRSARYGYGTSTCGVIEIAASDGSTGVGEIPDVEDPDAAPAAAEIERTLEAFLVGRDPRRINYLTDVMYEEVDFGPFDFHSFQQLALGAVDGALYDLVGTHYGVPVHGLLGGEYGPVPICWVAFTREDGDLSSLRADVEEQVEAGFDSFKIKVGDTDPDVDEERIRTVREVAGENATVLLDAQGLWDLEEALARIERYEPLGIDGVETPVGHPGAEDAPGAYYDIPLLPREMRTVREETDTPVLEHVLDPSFGLRLIEEEAVDVFTVEVCAGGITRAERVLDLAHAAGVDARLGSTVELGPGTAAAVALAASSPAVTYPSDLVGPDLYRESVIEEPLEYADGTLRPRDRPGLGLSLREGLL